MILSDEDWLVPDWPAPPNVHSCITTRHSRVSTDHPLGFNLALHVGDDPAVVDRHRYYLAKRLNCQPHWLSQVHGTAVVEWGAEPGAATAEADAAWTRASGVACAVLTADCLPILLCDQAGNIVAAVHAGWRGLAAGVVDNTVAALPCAPETLMAWLGPAIGPAVFEVGDEVRRIFMRYDTLAASAFVPTSSTGKWRADLPLLAQQRLQRLGVMQIYFSSLCTMTDTERFYSFRQAPQTGRFASLIWRTAGA